jgi:8-oxo-dGTP diphosphatase
MALTNITITTRLILESDGHVLYLKQTEKNGGGFTFPGGKVEQEEFAKDTTIRETLEETGIKIKKKELHLVHVLYKKLKNTTEVFLFFRASSWSGKVTSMEQEKFVDAVWYPSASPPKKLPRVLAFALKRIQQNKVYSEYPKVKVKVKKRK